MLEFFAALAGSWEDPAMDSIDGESKTSKRGLRPETLKLIRQRGAAGNEELSSELARTAMRADHIHTVSKLKVSQEYKLLLCLTFVKLKKAFGLAETVNDGSDCRSVGQPRQRRNEIRLCVPVAALISAFFLLFLYHLIQLTWIAIYHEQNRSIRIFEQLFSGFLSFFTPWILLLTNSYIASLFRVSKVEPLTIKTTQNITESIVRRQNGQK
ncbi:hypothetical protein RB195_003576 [Necator americanus]|uniref:Uncharacterized protein n=1 Tax=Necator americanus TaxID=51031 RepID=A0ABR1DQQ7_NECAM